MAGTLPRMGTDQGVVQPFTNFSAQTATWFCLAGTSAEANACLPEREQLPLARDDIDTIGVSGQQRTFTSLLRHMLRSEPLERWWPTTQSLDLVQGTAPQVAAAVEAEVTRFVHGEKLTRAWCHYADLDAAFGATTEFSNVPTHFLVLPTHSDWTVLWNNSFLCDGYDSLCSCITANHGLTTVHWNAHDSTTTTQPAAAFTHRTLVEATLVERSVYAAKEDGKWLFGEAGSPLPQEDVRSYLARNKRDRLNESLMASLLERLGAAPWAEGFYALPEQPCYVLQRSAAPTTIIRRPRSTVVGMQDD